MAEEQVLISVDIDQDEAFKALAATEQEMQELKEAQKELTQSFKEGEISQDEYAASLTDNKLKMAETRKEQRELTKAATAEKGSLQDLRNQVAKMVAQRNKINISTEEGRAEFDALNASILEQTNEIKALEQAGGDYRRNVGNYTNSVKDAIGQMGGLNSVFGAQAGAVRASASAFQGAIGSITETSKALRVFKIALVSTGIGAIVVALGSLIAFFTKTRKGTEIVSQVMAGLGAVISVVTDRLSMIGEALVNLVKGLSSPLETLKALKNAFTGVGDEMAREAQQAAQLEKDMQALERAEDRLIVQRAKSRNEISELILASRDLTATFEERSKVIEDAIKEQQELNEANIEQLEEELRIKREQLALGENLAEDDRELAELEAQLLEQRKAANDQMRELINRRNELANAEKAAITQTLSLEAQLFKIRAETQLRQTESAREQLRIRTMLVRQEAEVKRRQIEAEVISEQDKALKLTILEETTAANIEKIRAELASKIEAQRIQEIEAVRRAAKMREEVELVSAQALAEGKLAIEQDLANRVMITREQVAKSTVKVQEQAAARELAIAEKNKNAKENLLQSGFALANELTAENAILNKGVGIAEAIVNTARAVTQALASAPPPLSFALAGIVGALGAAQVAKIASTPIPGARGGGGRGSSTSINNTALTGSTLQSQNTQGAQLDAAARDISTRPVFVSVTDIQDGMNRAEVKDTTSTI